MRNWVDTPISGQLLKDWLTQGKITCCQCTEGLPVDAVFVRSWVDEWTNIAHVVWEHPSFDEVPENARIPYFDPVFRYLGGRPLDTLYGIDPREEK